MFEKAKIITINSHKFDGKIHKSWKAQLIEQKNPLLVFIGEFDEEVKHSQLGVIRRGTISYEYYWLDRFYNIFRFHEPDTALRNFYCNINIPPIFADDCLDYIDLDIDLVIWKDFKYEILDEDEFLENSKKYNYSKDLRRTVDLNIKALINLIENREFPFDTNL